MNDNNLTDNMTDFFADNDEDHDSGGFLGSGAIKVLHLTVLATAIYSGYHGINATRTYRAANGLGNAAGIIGILVIEVTMIGIYLAYFHKYITGKTQTWIAGITMAIGLTFSILGIVGDSQLQAGLEVSSWLATYLYWVLPFAPIIMAGGAALTLATSPTVIRRIKAALQRDKAAERRHDARMKADDAKLTIATKAANVQLNALGMVATYADQAYRSPQVQSFVQQTAIDTLPDLLRMAGVLIPYGTVIEGQAINVPQETAPAAPIEESTPAGLRGVLNNLRGRATPNPTTDTGNNTYTTPGQVAPVPPSFTPEALRRLAAEIEATDRRAAGGVPSANGQEEPTARPQ